MLTGIKVETFDLLLGPLDRSTHKTRIDRFIFVNTEATHHALNLLRAENTHEIILKGNEKLGLSKIALTTCPTSQLIVNPPCFVSLRPKYEKSTKALNLICLFGRSHRTA